MTLWGTAIPSDAMVLMPEKASARWAAQACVTLLVPFSITGAKPIASPGTLPMPKLLFDEPTTVDAVLGNFSHS